MCVSDLDYWRGELGANSRWALAVAFRSLAKAVMMSTTTGLGAVLNAHEANDLAVVIQRLRLLCQVDVLIPLILDASFFALNPAFPSLHSLLSVCLDLLSKLLRGGGLWPTRGGKIFKTIFDKLCIQHSVATQGSCVNQSGTSRVSLLLSAHALILFMHS